MSDKTAIELVEARIKQLEEKYIKMSDVLYDTKSRYEEIDEIIKMIGDKIDDDKLNNLKKKQEAYLKENMRLSNESNSIKSKIDENIELLEILKS